MFELGNNLREARQRRRIDLVAAEQDTKIRSKYLAALETEEFGVLPGPVFVRGFLRTYARYLELDPQLFIDEYNARFGRFEELDDQAASPALGRPGLAQEHAGRGRRTMRVATVVTLVVLGVLLWVALRGGGEDSATTRTPGHVARTSVDDASPTGAAAVAPSDGDALSQAATAARAKPAGTSTAAKGTGATARR